MASIQTNGLTKDFGGLRAVDNITLDIPEGGVRGFVGPNGAGKSTTIRMLLGLIRPTSGTAEVMGHPIEDPSAYLPRVGALIEAPAFYPSLTGEQNLRVFATLGKHDPHRISQVLDVVGLADRGGDRYNHYSLGMKQRLGIALALLPDPDLLVLDEPTNGLDPAGIVEIRQLLISLGASGKTVFVSSHLLSETQAACDSILVVDKGALVFNGTMGELLARTSPTIRATAESQTDTIRLAEMTARAGYPTRRVNGSIEIDAPANSSPDVNRLAWNAGITLSELQATAGDLEQAFFAMTGNHERGDNR